MFHYTKGDILKANVEAIVNTVNTVGVMGKGIALAFKKQFPENFKVYRNAFEGGNLEVGKMLAFETGESHPKVIINFPTKKHWRNPSEYEYIASGLKDLVHVIEDYKIKSIAIPPLGCGNGGLDWEKVKPMILDTLGPLSENVEIHLYEPGLFEEQKPVKSVSNLTAPRAMLLQLLNQYEMFGEEANALVMQKLAYLLQRCGEPLNLRYEKGFYGPFAHNLSKVIQALSPHYLVITGDISKPYSITRLNRDILPELENYLNHEITAVQRERLEAVTNLIAGFENMLGLELLATVDYAVTHCPECGPEEIIDTIHQWTTRKKQVLPAYQIREAYSHLRSLCSWFRPLI
ncbi:MAG TPA: macro domain-containing protein [Flavilitoribacter sp.]|nr:macro domain-containing protein [Flavilitoribacter sp.]HMQ89410.1 macro domain-containing protein [Flavilitoribacter sp.]